MNNNFGKLYIVSTPIGNLNDITLRAIDTLKEVDLIAAEDTRRTKELLNHFDIKVKTTSYHEHNQYDKALELIEVLKEGQSIAIVTDAGTPIISDPGCELVKKAIENDIEITAIPGACAGINALVLSGIDASSFVFIGFLSEDNKKRKEQLEEIREETRTMIFYISPHNIKDDLKSLIETFGKSRYASLSREMTKIHEETKRDTLENLLDYYEINTPKGEMVLVVSGLDKSIKKKMEIDKWQSITVEEHLKKYIDEGFEEKEAMKKVAVDRGIDKREIYKILKVK